MAFFTAAADLLYAISIDCRAIDGEYRCSLVGPGTKHLPVGPRLTCAVRNGRLYAM
jgi:hypothetical protein